MQQPLAVDPDDVFVPLAEADVLGREHAAGVFSILARKLLRRASFTSKEHLRARIEAFIVYFNRTLAKPFKWTMTGKPLVT
jgi:hypothetical protein